MAKLTLDDIASGYGSATKFNSNNDKIEAAVENTLSRDGTAPNTMEANLDMNSYRILNLPDATNNQEPLTLGQAATLEGFTIAATQGAVGEALWPQTAAELAAAVTPSDYAYPPGNVLRYGAVGNGTTDDTTAVANAIAVAKSTTFASTSVYFPAGTYLIDDGTLTYGSSATGILFYGDGPTSSTLKLALDGTNQVYFYNNTGAQSYRNTFRDLRFLGADVTYCNGFKLNDSAGWEKKFKFENCRFEDINYVLTTTGTTNADQCTFFNCEWYDINTLLSINNVQSMLHQFYGCFGTFNNDLIVMGANGGGEVLYVGGDLIHTPSGSAKYWINGSAGPATGVNNGQFTFKGVRSEHRGQYAKLVYWPVADITNRSRPIQITFDDCTLAVLNQGSGATRTDAVLIGEGKTVQFRSCVMPVTAAGSNDDWGFTITADNSGAPGVANPGTIQFLDCSVSQTLASKCTVTNVYGVYQAEGCVANEGSDDDTDRIAVNFTKGFNVATLGNLYAQTKLAAIKRRYWPRSDGASGFLSEGTVTLPAGAILVKAVLMKPSTSSGSTNCTYSIGTDNKGTAYLTTTEADYRAEHAKVADILIAPLAAATTFRLWITETSANTCTGAQEGGYAFLEYI